MSSSNYPRFEPNANTGAPHWQPGEPCASATNRVHLGGAHLSAVVLPVIE